mmetsp:Transcript_34929/g.87903  ORF Transcript_34929/g.87903 Transcript_34929/m.87903 type:complete len:99 (+) Transcript_34929:2862-3158(+)
MTSQQQPLSRHSSCEIPSYPQFFLALLLTSSHCNSCALVVLTHSNSAAAATTTIHRQPACWFCFLESMVLSLSLSLWFSRVYVTVALTLKQNTLTHSQ